MKTYETHNTGTKAVKFSTRVSALTLLPLCCALALTSNPSIAGKGDRGPHQERHADRDGYISDNVYGVENLAYFGDWNTNSIYIFDVDNMSLMVTVDDVGDGPYGIDQQSPAKAYALTRKTNSLSIVNNQTFENDGLIPLLHKPRSTNYNPVTDLTLVSGGDKAMTSIIRVKNDKVIQVIGENEETHPHDFGGSLSTGHPLWVTNQKFLMLDRAAREIQLWHRTNGLLSTLDTTTSVHHIFQPPASTIEHREKHIYYAVEEGNKDEPTSPAILRFKLHGNTLTQTGRIELNSIDPTTYDSALMGAHHASFRPDGEYIYVGSAEGNLFVIKAKTLEVEKVIKVGQGAGHTTFLPMREQAIITNHNDTFVSVIDTKNHRWIRNTEVADTASPDYKSQAHTTGVSLDMQYFYSAASHDGVFYRINLDTWVVNKTLPVDANLLMGSFIWDGDGSNM